MKIPTLLLLAVSWVVTTGALSAERPHIVLVMADDMGWGQTGYAGHPILKTPNLDAMAANGLRFDRFYAGAPNCSPTRASVMTGRSNDRTGVVDHGYALHRQEITIARLLRDAGYVTGHFGKWHLNGVRGPGVPVLGDDAHNPGAFGFDEWLSTTNYFDRNPLLSRMGAFESFEGDSSEVVVAEALQFIEAHRKSGRPTFTVIWYGTPHSPFSAAETDKTAFADLDRNSASHHGELVAMDRSIGALRAGLRDFGLAGNTLVWFNSDNGGLPDIQPATVGGLRGFKNSLFEGGLRVPAIIEWPEGITEARITRYPASTMDILPTLAEVAGLDSASLPTPLDGVSLKPLFAGEIGPREKPIFFRHQKRGALIDNQHKLLSEDLGTGVFQLYDIEADPRETTDLATDQPAIATRLRARFEAWNDSVNASQRGTDYPEGAIDPIYPLRRTWGEMPEYGPHLELFRKRPEYQSRFRPKEKAKP